MDFAAISSELDDHGFDDASDARKVSMLNDAYWDVCSRAPWPFLEKSIALTFGGTLSTAANFPTDYRAAFAAVVTAGTGAGNTLNYIRYEDWLKQYGNTTDTSGSPTMYYFIGNVPHFYPTPASSTVITMGYICIPAALTNSSAEADILLPVPFHRSVLVNGTLFKMYAMEDDTDIAPTFETYFERGITNMWDQLMRRQYTDFDRITIPEDYDSPWNLV